MKLNAPFIITSRLMAGLTIGEVTISIEYDGNDSEGRTVYRYFIDGPEIEHSSNDLKSGCQGGSLQDGMESLLSFLSAAGESYRYKGMEGENSDLFPESVTVWASQNSDEISMLACELEDVKDLIEE